MQYCCKNAWVLMAFTGLEPAKSGLISEEKELIMMPNLVWDESWSPPRSIDDVLMRLPKREGRGMHLKEVVRVFEKKMVHLRQKQYVPSLAP